MTELSGVFWRINFPLVLLLFQIVMCLPYRRRKYAALKWVVFVGVLILIVTTMTHDWVWDGSLIKAQNILSNMPGRILIMVVIALQIFICYEISLWSAVFLMTVAITVHRIHFSLYKIIEVFMVGSVVNKMPGWMSVLLDIAVIIVFMVAIAAIFNRKNGIRIDKYGRDKIVLIISLVILVLSDVLNLYQFANDPYTNFGMTLVVNRLVDIIFNSMTLYMIYNLIVKRTLQIEQQKMETLMQQRKQQYEFSQQLIDSINIKSHDLKKQIRYLEQHEVSRTDMVQGLKDAVANYDTLIQTNNEALSTILSEKSLVCYNNQIKFVCIADTDNLNCIKSIDLYTIMANLLDNAVEASQKVEVQYRSISVAVKQKENFISIHTENYFSGSIRKKGETLLTMKSEPENHGFGVKSIQQIVDSYQGNMSFKTKGNIFSVNILIPII